MKRLKLFEDFTKGDVKMIKLIDNEGVVLDEEGVAIEGSGIFALPKKNAMGDMTGLAYMAGVSADGTIYVDSATDNGALNYDGDEFDIKVGSKYDGRKEYKMIKKY